MPRKKKAVEEVKKDIDVELEDYQTAAKDILANSEATLDCIKELTKTVAELVAEWQKWSAAGKF